MNFGVFRACPLRKALPAWRSDHAIAPIPIPIPIRIVVLSKIWVVPLLAKHIIRATIVALAIGATACHAQNEPSSNSPDVTPVGPLVGSKVHLTYSDDFTAGLDRSIWSTGLANPGEANPKIELQHYHPSEIATSAHTGLTLTAHLRSFEGKEITAGAINSSEGFSQLYGHFEIKAKMAGGAGSWPAFWLLPADDSWPPEIDVFEYLGRMPKSFHVGGIEKGPEGKRLEHGDYAALPDDASKSYHIYAVDWRPGLLVWAVDGKEVYRQTADVPKKAMYMVLNLAYGGPWAGPVNAETPFPARFDVAYVRVYQYDDLPPAPPRPLQFTKLQLSRYEVRSGDTVDFNGGVIAGSDVKGVNVATALTEYLGPQQFATALQKLGDIAKSSRAGFSGQLRIPNNVKPGVYNVRLEADLSSPVADAASGKQIRAVYRLVAAQITVLEDTKKK